MMRLPPTQRRFRMSLTKPVCDVFRIWCRTTPTQPVPNYPDRRARGGKTNGRDSAPGTIRGDFGTSRQMNLVHASDGSEAAVREMKLYFDDAEICAYEPTLAKWLQAADE